MSQEILTLALPSEQYALLQQRAIIQQKNIDQLGLEIIRNWLRQQTQIEENAALESKKEQALEAAYREYYAHAEEDLRIVRNMHNAQMRAFKRSQQEKS